MKILAAGANEAPSKSGKSWLSKIIAWLHLWPSLVSAVILIVICLTGTMIVYCDEIIDFSNRDALYVSAVSQKKLPAEELISRFRKAYPHRDPPGYIIVYRDARRTVKFNSFDDDKGLRSVYMDPYTGKILKDDGTIYFFYITAHIHASLLWHGVGEWIISISTIIFLMELITGLVLWWPVKWTRTTRDASFKIKWKAKFKRVNYDLHNVLGFYSLSIALVLTVTGLIIAFQPWAEFTIKTFGGNPSHEWEEALPAFHPNKQPTAMDTAIASMFARYPDKTAAQILTYRLDSAGYYMVNAAKKIGLKSADGPEYAYFNRFTGQQITVPKSSILHEEIENTYWALHMGTWMGQVGKFFTFTGGLISTSLPITGFLIWWGRRKKKSSKVSNVKSSNPKVKKAIPASRTEKPSKLL